jgi:hypothetical protein
MGSPVRGSQRAELPISEIALKCLKIVANKTNICHLKENWMLFRMYVFVLIKHFVFQPSKNLFCNEMLSYTFHTKLYSFFKQKKLSESRNIHKKENSILYGVTYCGLLCGNFKAIKSNYNQRESGIPQGRWGYSHL